MWTDTHLHLDASEYDSDRAEVLQRAQQAHIKRFVLPAVDQSNFLRVKNLAHQTPGAVYCLGIHPLFVQQSSEADLDALKRCVQTSIDDPLFAGIGEIGLDYFIANPDVEKQTKFFHAQLRLARDFDLPVVMHVRKAQDHILKGLRMFQPRSGIAHAFNGSFQQAETFIKLKMCLGFGGACTYTRALQLRRLVTELPMEAIVLETDGPDIAPEWITKQRNEPAHLAQIAEVIASLRQLELHELSRATESNAQKVLPALGML